MPYSINNVNVEMGKLATKMTGLDEADVRLHLLAEPHPAKVSLYPDFTPEHNIPIILTVTNVTESSCKISWTGGNSNANIQLRCDYKKFDGTFGLMQGNNSLINGQIVNFDNSAGFANTAYGYFEMYLVARFNDVDYLPSAKVVVQFSDWTFTRDPTYYSEGSSYHSDYPNWKGGFRYDNEWLWWSLHLKGMKASENGTLANADIRNIDVYLRRNMTIITSKNYQARSVYNANAALTIAFVLNNTSLIFKFEGIAEGYHQAAVKLWMPDTAYSAGDVVHYAVADLQCTCIQTHSSTIEPATSLNWGNYWSLGEARNPSVPIEVNVQGVCTFINNGTIYGGSGSGGRGANVVVTDAIDYGARSPSIAYGPGAIVTYYKRVYLCIKQTVYTNYVGAYEYSKPQVNGGNNTYWLEYSPTNSVFSKGSAGTQGGIAIRNTAPNYIAYSSNGITSSGGNGGGGGGGGTIPTSRALIYGVGGRGSTGSRGLLGIGGNGGNGWNSSYVEVDPSVDGRYRGGIGGAGTNGFNSGISGSGSNPYYAGDGVGGAVIAGIPNWAEGLFTVSSSGTPRIPTFTTVPTQSSIVFTMIPDDFVGLNTPSVYNLYDNNNTDMGSTTGTTFVLNGLYPDTPQTYYIIATNAGGSARSLDQTITTLLPTPVVTLAAGNGYPYNSFDVNIVPVAAATSYEIYFNNELRATVLSAGVYSTGANLTVNTLYSVKVKALTGSNYSAFSTIVNRTTDNLVAPGLARTLEVSTPVNNSVVFSWLAPNTGGTAEYYVAYAQLIGTSTILYGNATLDGNVGASLSCTISGLVVGGNYKFYVEAWNYVGHSSTYAIALPIVMSKPVISVSNITDRTFTVSFNQETSPTYDLYLGYEPINDGMTTPVLVASAITSPYTHTPATTAKGKHQIYIKGSVANTSMTSDTQAVTLTDWTSFGQPRLVTSGCYAFDDSWVYQQIGLPSYNPEANIRRNVIATVRNGISAKTTSTAFALTIDFFQRFPSDTYLFTIEMYDTFSGYDKAGGNTYPGVPRGAINVINNPVTTVNIRSGGILTGAGGQGGRGGGTIANGTSTGISGSPGGPVIEGMGPYSKAITFNVFPGGRYSVGSGGGGGGGGAGSAASNLSPSGFQYQGNSGFLGQGSKGTLGRGSGGGEGGSVGGAYGATDYGEAGGAGQNGTYGPTRTGLGGAGGAKGIHDTFSNKISVVNSGGTVKL
jgi:hypothetical protein